MASKKGLSDRWKTEAGEVLAGEVVRRLTAGHPLDGLSLGSHDGHIDLRGLSAPTPRRLQHFRAAGLSVEELGDLVEFKGVRLADRMQPHEGESARRCGRHLA